MNLEEFNLVSTAERISRDTGLDPAVIADQLIAEQGQNAFTGKYYPVTTNPFNIGPNYHYANVEEGIKAYENLINTSPLYAGIRQSIQSHNPAAELEAIAASPFDASHYSGGSTKEPGSALYENFPLAASATLENPDLGISEKQFTDLVKTQIKLGTSNVGPGESVKRVLSGLGTALSNTPSMIWQQITQNATKWFLYIVLTIVIIISLIMLLGGGDVVKEVVTK